MHTHGSVNGEILKLALEVILHGNKRHLANFWYENLLALGNQFFQALNYLHEQCKLHHVAKQTFPAATKSLQVNAISILVF